MKSLVALLFTGLLFAQSAFALTEKSVTYQQDGQSLEGFVVYPDGLNAGDKVPGVIIVHEWDGLGDYVKGRARRVAKLGYVAFAADIYGKGIHANTPEEAGKLAGHYKGDRPLLRSRAVAAYDEIKSLPDVDPTRIAVMGYCFGGTTSIELGMSGAALAGIVSFHGGLDFPDLGDLSHVKTKLLVLHGADDPTMSANVVKQFKDEAKKDHVDMKFISYPGAVHAFTNPAHVYKPGSPVGYNKAADEKSWEEMKKFFAQNFKPQS
jgi:dienelactone hydrolase